METFKINYKSDFVLRLASDAGWGTAFTLEFWSNGAPTKRYYATHDGNGNYTNCKPDSDTELRVMFDDHGLGIGNLMLRITYSLADEEFRTGKDDEVVNVAAITVLNDEGEEVNVVLNLEGETAAAVQYSLPLLEAERKRQNAEAQRNINETQRIAAEQQRQLAETLRNQAELDRQASEDVRKSNESTREAAEQQRQTAEAARAAEFKTNEAARKETFETNEAERQATFEANEAERQVLYEKVAKNTDGIELLNTNTGVSEYPEFSEATAYAVGDVVLYEGLLKRFISAHEAGAWDGSQVEAWSLNTQIDEARSALIFTNGIEIATIVNDKYPKYSSGDFTTAGTSTQIDSYIVSVSNQLSIRAFCGLRDSIPSAIAFYSSDTPTTAGYIKESSVEGYATKEGSWFEAKVPVNAKIAVIPNVRIFVEHPQIILTSTRTEKIASYIKEETAIGISSINKDIKSEVIPFETLKNKYVRLSDGTLVSASPLHKTIKYDVKGLRKLYIQGTWFDNVPAAVAYYKEDGTYLPEYSKGGYYTSQVVTIESEVPEEASYALSCSSDKDGNPNPKVYTTSIGAQFDAHIKDYNENNEINKHDLLILDAEDIAVDRPIDYQIDLTEYPIGTVFRLAIIEASKKPTLYIRNSEGQSVVSPALNIDGDISFIKTREDIVRFQIYMSYSEETPNTFVGKFYAMKHSPAFKDFSTCYVSEELSMPTFSFISGYHNTGKDVTSSGYWVTTEIYKEYGYKIHFNANFTDYYYEICLYGYDFGTPSKINISEECDIDLSSGIFGWSLQFRTKDYTGISDINAAVVNANINLSNIRGYRRVLPIYKPSILSELDFSDDSAVIKRINIKNHDIGTQYRLSVVNKDFDSDCVVYFGNNNNKYVMGHIVVHDIGDYYFEKPCNAEVMTINKPRTDTGSNILKCKLYKLPVAESFAKRVLTSYSPRTSGSLSLGTPFSGYWTTPTTIHDDGAWVCYPIQYNNNYRIRINADFSIYYVALKLWDNEYKSYVEKTITEESVVDIHPLVTAWHLQFRRIDRASLNPAEVDGVISVTMEDEQCSIYEKPATISDLNLLSNKVEGFNSSINTALENSSNALETVDKILLPNPFRNAPYYAHYAANGFIKDGSGKNAIASESLEDIEMAARLGFGFIEANIHKNGSGDFICIHGSGSDNGQVFGPEVKSLNGSDAANMVIAETSTEYMETNIRYASDYLKYQTKVPTLERFLKCCKENNIGIFAGTQEKEAIDMCVHYLGKDNVIMYNPPSDIRQYFGGYLFVWNNSAALTTEELISNADRFGAPYMCGIGPSLLTQMKNDNTLDGFIQAMHEKGYLVGIAAVYQSEKDVRDCFRRGMDFGAAGHEVNPFTHNFKCYDIDGDTAQFITSGTISEGIVSLTSGQTLQCGTSDDAISMGKVYLTIRFTGSLTINLGTKGNRNITSDGSESVVISDYLLKHKPQLLITANTDTTITSLVFKVSRV